MKIQLRKIITGERIKQFSHTAYSMFNQASVFFCGDLLEELEPLLLEWRRTGTFSLCFRCDQLTSGSVVLSCANTLPSFFSDIELIDLQLPAILKILHPGSSTTFLLSPGAQRKQQGR